MDRFSRSPVDTIVFRDVSLCYHSLHVETVALERLSFSVKEGEFVVLLGPSGCGKSTVLSLISGLLPPGKGEIFVNGKKQTGTVSIDVGYMFQHDHLFPWTDLYHNMLLGPKIQHKLTPAVEKRVRELLEKYGLSCFEKHHPSALSGGMRQRAALIRTLVTNPSILLLDEPFSALDYQTRISVSEDIVSIIKDEKKTAVMVTHDISEALSLADRILIFSGRPARLKREITVDLPGIGTARRRNSPLFSTYFDTIWKELDDSND